MRKVIIPTDFSENAMNAIIYAMELFKYDRSDFTIVHAFADTVYENTMEMSRTFFEEYKAKVKKGTDKQLEEVLSKMKEVSPNPRHNYEYKSVFGSLVDTVNDLVNKENADIVVMGTKGATDDRDITFGSETLQVMKYVKCPVLAVPEGYHDRPPVNILFPTNFMLPYKGRELKLLSTIAKNFTATINFLHITNGKTLSFRQQDNKSFLECYVDENFVMFNEIVANDLTPAINHFIENNEINFLVMVNSRHSYLENIMYTSTIEKIGLKISIPFLVLQNLPR
ncbi:MAG: universal stress protein [Flavobacteriaceae bacterium]|nr:universal stress protein [Flavobacteriaceae bacterium]